MSGFFEEFMGSYNPFDSAGYDEQVIMRNSLFAVVPKIAKTSLLKCNVFVLKCFILKRKSKTDCRSSPHFAALCVQTFEKRKNDY